MAKHEDKIILSNQKIKGLRPVTRRRIIEAALLVYAKNPNASLEQVATYAEMGRATLFRYFSGKKILLAALHEESFQRCLNIIQPFVDRAQKEPQKGIEILHDIIAALMPLGASFSFLLDEHWDAEDAHLCALEDRYNKTWQTFLHSLQSCHLLRADMPIDWMSDALKGIFLQAWNCVQQKRYTDTQATNFVMATFLHGMSAT